MKIQERNRFFLLAKLLSTLPRLTFSGAGDFHGKRSQDQAILTYVVGGGTVTPLENVRSGLSSSAALPVQKVSRYRVKKQFSNVRPRLAFQRPHVGIQMDVVISVGKRALQARPPGLCGGDGFNIFVSVVAKAKEIINRLDGEFILPGVQLRIRSKKVRPLVRVCFLPLCP